MDTSKKRDFQEVKQSKHGYEGDIKTNKKNKKRVCGWRVERMGIKVAGEWGKIRPEQKARARSSMMFCYNINSSLGNM